MKIITVSGLDGSGKSTQIEFLKKDLQEQGKTFWYFHAIDFSFGNKILGKKKDGSGKEVSVEKAGWFKIFLRKISLLIDIFRFKRLLKKSKFDYVISDRYFFDSVVNISYLETRFPSGRLCAEKYIPEPDYAFFLKASPQTIMRRERKPDQGIEYLKAKEEIYERKAKDWEMIVLDGEKSKEEIHRQVKSNLQ